MQYSCQIEIDRPRTRVVELFEDSDRMGEWQDGLISFKPLAGTQGTPGATSEIRYKMGRREIEMTETMESYDLPDSMVAVYEADKVWNRNANRFVDLGDRTRWEIDAEFRCGGFVGIMARIMPGMFRKQTMKMMNDFKAFVEREPAAS